MVVEVVDGNAVAVEFCEETEPVRQPEIVDLQLDWQRGRVGASGDGDRAPVRAGARAFGNVDIHVHRLIVLVADAPLPVGNLKRAFRRPGNAVPRVAIVPSRSWHTNF